MQSDAEIERIESFASSLARFAAQVRESFARLGSATEQLSGSWRDDQFAEFEQAFRLDSEHLREFAAEAERVAQVLRQDAARLREVRAIRTPGR